MKPNPPAINLVTLPAAAPSANVIELLEELLELARTGEIHSVATAVMYRNEDTQTRWATGAGLRGGLMLSAIVMLQRDWEDRMLEERNEL
jgi:hypothetical protein